MSLKSVVGWQFYRKSFKQKIIKYLFQNKQLKKVTKDSSNLNLKKIDLEETEVQNISKNPIKLKRLTFG